MRNVWKLIIGREMFVNLQERHNKSEAYSMGREFKWLTSGGTWKINY